VPHVSGTSPPKEPPHIIGALLTFESDWSPPFGKPLTDALYMMTAKRALTWVASLHMGRSAAGFFSGSSGVSG
jgi:hypothetical protein